MARTNKELTPREEIMVGELNTITNSKILYKDSTGSYIGIGVGTGLTMSGGNLNAVGTGGVVGPVSAVDNRVVFFDGMTGKLIKDSGLTLSGSNTGDQTTISGNAGSATVLQTTRAIYGNNFDGSAALTNNMTVGVDSTTAGSIIFKNATNAFIQKFTGSNPGADIEYILPTTAPTVGQVLSSTAPSAGVATLSWATAGGGLSWGASISSGNGIGLTMTSADLGGDKAFQSSIHTASGTLTACTTTQNTYATNRTHTNTSSVTDNFIGTLFSRTNIMNQAGGTLLAQGPVVKITGTDTQTAGTLTPSYNLLELTPSLRSTGSSINLTQSGNNAVNPTNGHFYQLLGNTQNVAHIMQKIDLGTSAQGHTGLLVTMANASTTASGISIDPGSTTTGAGIRFTPSSGGGDGYSSIKWIGAINATSANAKYGINMTTIGQNGRNGIGWYVANLENASGVGTSVGKYFSLNNAVSSNLTGGRTTDASEILYSSTNTSTSATLADNFNIAYFKRTSVQNGAGGTYTAAGSVLKLENVATQTAGTLTDTVSVLTLAQGIATTGSLITMVSGNTNSRAIDFATNLTTATAPTGASSYINVKINGVAHRILAQAV